MTDASAAQPALYGAHPPKPTLTLRVGVSGHRPKPKTFPAASFAFARRRLGEVFIAIEKALAELKDADKGFYAADADGTIAHKVRLVSGLAEGADQMAVDARPPGWDLDAVLPFPREYFLADFAKSAIDDATDVSAGFTAALARATTVVELPRDPRMPLTEPADEKERKEYWKVRNPGYARLGHFLLGQIDVLVAVWNGGREDGPGGTAEVVRGALDAGIPVVWVSTLEDVPPRMVADVDENSHPVAPQADGLSGPLKRAIATIVSVPAADAGTPLHTRRHHDARERLNDFFGETWPPPTRAVVYDMFKRWTDAEPLRWLIKPEEPAQYASSWDTFLNDATLKPDTAGQGPGRRDRLPDRIRAILLPRFAWTDALAVERSHRYRSAYVIGYLLAILLAAIALLGVFTHDWFHDEEAMLAYKAILVAAEFALILLIVYIVRRGTRRRWLERWVEYRALAEMLRSARFLTLIGEHGYIQRSHDLEPASSAWFLWYLRATTRELGLPGAHLDGAYQNKVLLAVETHVVDDQLAYNKPVAKSLASMHHVLHQAGNLLFVLTGAMLFLFFAACAVYFLGGLSADETAPWRNGLRHALVGMKSYVTFLAAFLPACGAALFGIRETGDFEGFAERAARTADKLAPLKAAMAKARRRLVLESTTATLLSTAQILSEDVGAWQSVYGRKQLSLPA